MLFAIRTVNQFYNIRLLIHKGMPRTHLSIHKEILANMHSSESVMANRSKAAKSSNIGIIALCVISPYLLSLS